MSEWSKVCLGELIKVKHGFAFPGQFITSEMTDRILVTPGNFCIGGGFKQGKFKYFSSHDYPAEYQFLGAELIVTMTDLSKETDTLGYSAVVPSDGKVYLHNQRVGLIEPISDQSCLEFVYWLMRWRDYQEFIVNSASGTSVMHTSPSRICEFEFELPPLPEQKAIASVLSSLDDKIDLLHRQNKTLEAMAETLFRHWFIEEAKEDWEEVHVKDFVTLNKASVSKDYPYNEIAYLDTGSLTKGLISELQAYQLQEAPSRAKRLVRHNDILISTVRPNQCHYGIVSQPKDNLVVSTGFCTITCESISPYFVYLLLTNTEMTEYLHSIAEGSTSTYPSLKPEDIGSVTFQMPPKGLLQQFHKLAESYWQKIHSNHKQIQTLENLRDTLLPKLMSGEVRVQYQTEEVA
ncbi:hypothetical protein F972_02885 [Acinetobacter sp. CIP 102529]|uniref:restriction endonuclease subunit S n=1 Tax=Acinetobacter TaxID=469 RepID=UPI0002CE433A|nr:MULTISPECIES: restriction endonuclease subunit S [Acinetobacter]ENU87827.1 hypothetical protein F972_02885 [Acinetobacter sp. CIP 102529]MCU4395291.1 restriction endonuclease subunit S [Acinetobacter parvus]